MIRELLRLADHYRRACPASLARGTPLGAGVRPAAPTARHPLGCHRPRIPDRIVFDKLLQVLVFGCAYQRIADPTCSERTLRRRRDEWMDAGIMPRLERAARDAYDRLLGLNLDDLAVDGCITKPPAAARPPATARSTGASRA
jgi:transposase